MTVEAEMVHLQYRMDQHEQRMMERHQSVCESIAKIEVALAVVLECLTEHRTYTEHDEEIEEGKHETGEEETGPEGETEEHPEEEETGEITEVEPEHVEVAAEVMEEVLLEDAEETTYGVPFGR